MRPGIIVLTIVGLSVFLAFLPKPSAKIVVRNESGVTVKTTQVNVVRSDTRGRLQQSPLTEFDQIFQLGAIAAGEERIQEYKPAADYNIDTYVEWTDGRTARYYRTYVVDDWYALLWPAHTITVTQDGLLFDGLSPAPVEKDPEGDYGQFDQRSGSPTSPS